MWLCRAPPEYCPTHQESDRRAYRNPERRLPRHPRIRALFAIACSKKLHRSEGKSPLYSPAHPTGSIHTRMVSRSAPPDTSAIHNTRLSPLLRFSRGKVCPSLLCANFMWMLIKRKATGLRRYTQHFIHLLRGSDRAQTLTSPVFPRRLMVSGLHENGFETSATTLVMAPQNRWPASDNGSRLRAHWPSTLIEKMPAILSLISRCTG